MIQQIQASAELDKELPLQRLLGLQTIKIISFRIIDFQILRTKMHASTYKYKTLEITHGWTGPIRRQNGLKSEPMTQHLLEPTISPFASNGARLLLRLAGSTCRNFLSGFKQTWDESKDGMSEANVPLNHVIKILLVIC